MRAAALFLGGLLACTAAGAHELKMDSQRETASVVRLSWADGQPFAFEAYELYLPGQDVPTQVGRTDAFGRIVFLPGANHEWRIRAFSADGHGVDQLLQLDASEGGNVGDAAGSGSAAGGDKPRAWLLAAGLGVVFGLFGLVQLFMRRRRP
ncbi:hypothetical protein [Rhodocyclus purpureus]|uniref:hypothetical protein n=1 Tax=Rhodocyclus purpureus TaxID=1067 RepID=UPI001911EADD|nr:hypothetical protein [Rhodocyclus purpureus]MBK5914763.1 hypothetical protein [Rhodocyclus purpureus]